jgi:hypothetical protein
MVVEKNKCYEIISKYTDEDLMEEHAEAKEILSI